MRETHLRLLMGVMTVHVITEEHLAQLLTVLSLKVAGMVDITMRMETVSLQLMAAINVSVQMELQVAQRWLVHPSTLVNMVAMSTSLEIYSMMLQTVTNAPVVNLGM